MKFRKNNTSKIKYKHSFIKGLQKFLEKIEHWEEIQSINPGIIEPTKTHGNFVFQIQYNTKIGIKALVKSDGAVQEVFIISNQIEELLKKLKNL